MFETWGADHNTPTGTVEMKIHEDQGERSAGLPWVAEAAPLLPINAVFLPETPSRCLSNMGAGPLDPPPRDARRS